MSRGGKAAQTLPPRARSLGERLLGVAAHLIIVPCWTVSPFLPVLALVAVGWSHGLVGIVVAVSCFFAIFFGPPGFLFSGVVWLVPFAMALAAPAATRTSAALGSLAFGLFLYIINCAPFAPWEGFYRLVTERMSGTLYYDRIELRGALEEIRPGRTFFAAHPHGILCCGWGWNCIWNSEFHKRTGPIGFLIDSNLKDKNPLFRVLADWYKGEQRYFEVASGDRIRRAMERGDSLSIVPGGFQDATLLEYGKDRTMIKKRKGFIKYCLQYGYRLTPVYTFGETSTFHTWTGALDFRLWLNKFGIPAVAIFGNPLIPFLPRTDAPLLTYVGAPLELPKVEKPTPEEVDLWHGRYLEALKALFEEKKAEAGYPNAVLEIW
mmetsp:Transcript_154270/g.474090  ORF Transcript_154270/g.474090 Transcript_154270/m.474090 type:complete len:378 (+) Transcript_154270:91-1224(+)